MRITLIEPVSPRYIYINPVTNKVHILMPIMSGTEIGLDNTCRSAYSLQEFFGKSHNPKQVAIIDELNHYKEALTWDLAMIPEDLHPLKEQKQERLTQINAYMDLIQKVQAHKSLKTLETSFPEYPEPLHPLMSEKETNLFSFILCPSQDKQDTFLRSVNPVFSLHHDLSDGRGHRKKRPSKLQKILFEALISSAIKPQNTRTQITEAVLSAVDDAPDLVKIQSVLGEKIHALCGLPLTTYQKKEGLDISLNDLNTHLGVELTTNIEYLDALLGYCTPELFDTLLESPFDTIRPAGTTSDELAKNTAESLSIITQFFLASVNIHCRAQGLSAANFGKILDASEDLCDEIAECVTSAMLSKTEVEDSLLDFFNRFLEDFKLTRALNLEEMTGIKKKFAANYAMVKESPHFDEFMLFDPTKPGKFVNHQGAICTDICEFATFIENSHFAQAQCRDFASLPRTIPSDNKSIASSIDLDIPAMDEEQFALLLEKAPKEIKKELQVAYPERTAKIEQIKVLPKFLLCVARGQQDEAKKLLIESTYVQTLLKKQGHFTDYSGRTFNCTAFEYAYWAKDAYMCRMLEAQMDAPTKALMSEKITKIETEGLKYTQNGEPHQTPHYDLRPLKQALKHYIDNHEDWSKAFNLSAIKTAWLQIGLAQRDVPAHVAQEYCIDRSLKPIPQFNEPVLPRTMGFYDYINESDSFWFPLSAPNAGLGYNFAILGGGIGGLGACATRTRCTRVEVDLNAITQLDKVRTENLLQLRHRFNPPRSSSCAVM